MSPGPEYFPNPQIVQFNSTPPLLAFARPAGQSRHLLSPNIVGIELGAKEGDSVGVDEG